MEYAIALGGTPLPPQTSPNIVIHHPVFGVSLKEKPDAVGIPNVLHSKGDSTKLGAKIPFLSQYPKPGFAPRNPK